MKAVVGDYISTKTGEYGEVVGIAGNLISVALVEQLLDETGMPVLTSQRIMMPQSEVASIR